MPTYVFHHDRCGLTVEVERPMARAGDPEYCQRCWTWVTGAADAAEAEMRRIFTPPQRAIVRPSGYRLSPDDPKYGDFRRELALGELKEDPTPLKFSEAELASFDHVDVAIPDDPERDRQLAQLVHQHWTNDLSDDTVRRRELESKALQEGKL